VKTVLVTGGGGAIGAAICRRFSGQMRVLVADKNREAAERAARETGGKALVFDISKYEEAKAALDGDINLRWSCPRCWRALRDGL
jgi:2-hydroxycyclohexanecarboxyl-CoA dehydrogenase